MRIVVDSNIVFSAILNTNGKISRILLHPKSRLNLYSTRQLLEEIYEHFEKLKSISGYSEKELSRIISLVTGRIRFIDPRLIPLPVFLNAENLTRDIDIDDTEFVALTDHAKAKLWSGDKKLIMGLRKKNWKKAITTDELSLLLFRKSKQRYFPIGQKIELVIPPFTANASPRWRPRIRRAAPAKSFPSADAPCQGTLPRGEPAQISARQ